MRIRKGVNSASTGLTPFYFWCRDPESNWGHADFQSAALPTELSRQPYGRYRRWILSVSKKKLYSGELKSQVFFCFLLFPFRRRGGSRTALTGFSPKIIFVNSLRVRKTSFPSFRQNLSPQVLGRESESSYIRELSNLWTPVSTGVTTFYEITNL